MPYAGFSYAIADSFLKARANMGDGWKNAMMEVADILVRPEILQVANVDDMDAFGRISPQLTPGMNTGYFHALDGKTHPFGTAA